MARTAHSSWPSSPTLGHDNVCQAQAKHVSENGIDIEVGLTALTTLAQTATDNRITVGLTFRLSSAFGFQFVAMATVSRFGNIAKGGCAAE